MTEIEHEDMEVDWESIDQITQRLDDEKNVKEWLESLLASEDFANCETAVLTIWDGTEGRMACFRIGYRIILAGLLDYSRRIVQTELKSDLE